MNNLTPLKSTKGQPADGENKYFPREKIVKKILRDLNNGENLLISAPRWIGKSTILKHIKNNPQENQIIKYIIIQSVDTSEEFFKKLYNELISDKTIFEGLDGYFKRTSSNIRAYASKISSFSIHGTVKINTEENINYYEESIKIINSLETNKKIFIFIDEFPDALNNILSIDKSLAINFLQQNRDLRMEFSNKNLQFVYTGSTGLINVVKKINKLDLINDIDTIKVLPLKKENYSFAIEVLNYIAKNDFIEYSKFCDLGTKHEVKDHKYILDVLEYDGYISEVDTKYGFNSILLKEWWYINVAT